MILFPFTGQPLLGDHLVDGADIGVHARFDYVHGNAAAGECFAVLLEADGRFAKRVFARGDGADGVIVKRVAGLCNLVYGLEHRVDRAVADGDVVEAFSRMAQRYARGGIDGVAAVDDKALEHEALGYVDLPRADNGLQILVRHRLFAVSWDSDRS